MNNKCTVSNANDLDNAIKNKIEYITLTGSLAQNVIKKNKAKKVGKGIAIATGVAATVGTAIATVATRGLAAPALISSAAATIRGGTIVLSTAEVALALGTIAGISCFTIKTLSDKYSVVDVNAKAGTVSLKRK